MSYYPILNAPNCKGWTTLSNFPPNNWESSDNAKKYVNVSWADNGIWHTKNIGVVESNQFRQISIEEVESFVPELSLPLLSMTSSIMPERSTILPDSEVLSEVPAWRGTLGLSTGSATTSYQGEIDPFPAKASLLTFCPFLQLGIDVSNYLIFLNIEKSPVSRKSQLDIYNPMNTEVVLGTFEVRNNSATVINLDNLDFKLEDFPMIMCQGMTGIPVYFSVSKDGSFVSLEHTHPPASLVIHGDRRGAQKILKNKWFSKVSKS
jgi:hypothetical protein